MFSGAVDQIFEVNCTFFGEQFPVLPKNRFEDIDKQVCTQGVAGSLPKFGMRHAAGLGMPDYRIEKAR